MKYFFASRGNIFGLSSSIKIELTMRNHNENIILFMKHYNKHKQAVYNYCLKMLGDKEKTNDVVQNVFMKFFENISLIRESEKIPIWLFTTARNEIYGFYREKKKPVDFVDDESLITINAASDDDPTKELENNELKNLVLTELDNFSEENRETFYLREFGELSYKEISKVMNADVNLVKSRLYKTRQKLIEKISKLI